MRGTQRLFAVCTFRDTLSTKPSWHIQACYCMWEGPLTHTDGQKELHESKEN